MVRNFTARRAGGGLRGNRRFHLKQHGNGFSNTKTDKNRKNYACHVCHFSPSDLKDYNRHLATRKHQSATQATGLATHSPVLAENNTLSDCQGYTCGICNKYYINRTGLWRHKKSAYQTPIQNTSTVPHLLQFPCSLPKWCWLSSVKTKNYKTSLSSRITSSWR